MNVRLPDGLAAGSTVSLRLAEPADGDRLVLFGDRLGGHPDGPGLRR